MDINRLSSALDAFALQDRRELARAVNRWAVDTLAHTRHADIDNPEKEARDLLAFAQGRERFILPPEEIGPQEIVAYYELVQRRALGEPFAHIVGAQGFWSLDFKVDGSTLIPRPDTETLLELLLSLRPDRTDGLRMLDLGTGTGCILLAALSEYPNASGIGVDINPDAVRLACVNARANGLTARSEFRRGSWGEAMDGQFDIILSNPPYITRADMARLSPEVVKFEPRTALCGGADGLDAYRAILGDAHRLLASCGIGIFEIGFGQLEAVGGLIGEYGFKVRDKRRDLAGIVRAVAFAR